MSLRIKHLTDATMLKAVVVDGAVIGHITRVTIRPGQFSKVLCEQRIARGSKEFSRLSRQLIAA